MSVSAKPVQLNSRERSIDLFKGLLVIGMVYCHTLQFFSDPQIYPASTYWIDVINLITFSGFVFSFGYVSQLAYYTKPFLRAAPRMLIAALKTLIAFYISGVAFRIIHDGQLLSWENIRAILLLEDIPGWSEFLISFTYLMILGLVLFVPLRWLSDRKGLAFVITGILLLTTLFPYERVHSSQLGLMFGSYNFATFPPVQYFAYYLLGILFAKYRIHFDWRVFIGAALASAIFLWKLRSEGELPQRFPPSVYWIVGPALLLYGYYLLARVMERWVKPFAIVESMGRNVLLYLVITNLLIFTVKSSQTNLLLCSGSGLYYAAGFLAIAAFCSWINTKPPHQLRNIKE
ncbi:hypothetical protein D3C71_587650 [compost metagenome]